MDLPEWQAVHFWRRYEALVSGAGSHRRPREAFVAALEEAFEKEHEGELQFCTAASSMEATSTTRSEPQAVQRIDEEEDEEEDERDPMDAAVDVALAAIAAAREPQPQQMRRTPAVVGAQLAGGAGAVRGRARGRGRPQLELGRSRTGAGGEGDSHGRSAVCAGVTSNGVAGASASGVTSRQYGSGGVRGKAPAPPPPNRAPAIAPQAQPPHQSYAGIADASAAEARDLAAWLQASLTPVLGVDAAEGISAGVEVVLANSRDDPEATINAQELVKAELADDAASEAVIKDFEARLACFGHHGGGSAGSGGRGRGRGRR